MRPKSEQAMHMSLILRDVSLDKDTCKRQTLHRLTPVYHISTFVQRRDCIHDNACEVSYKLVTLRSVTRADQAPHRLVLISTAFYTYTPTSNRIQLSARGLSLRVYWFALDTHLLNPGPVPESYPCGPHKLDKLSRQAYRSFHLDPARPVLHAQLCLTTARWWPLIATFADSS